MSEHLQPNFPKNVWRSLHRQLCGIDPNWCTARLYFNETTWEINTAMLNGPKLGDSDFLAKLPKLLYGKFFALLKTYVETYVLSVSWMRYNLCVGGMMFYNPSYQIELINERTEIAFEHCVKGIVYNYTSRKHTFDIRDLRCMLSGKSEMFVDRDGRVWNESWPMTVQELKQQLKHDGPNFQATGIYYLPPLR